MPMLEPQEAAEITEWLVLTGQLDGVEMAEPGDQDENPEHGQNRESEMAK